MSCIFVGQTVPYSPNNTKDDCAMLLDVRKPLTYRNVAVSLSQEITRSEQVAELVQAYREKELTFTHNVTSNERGELVMPWQGAPHPWKVTKFSGIPC